MRRQSLSGAWQFRQIGTEPWLPAAVPGGVHTDLMATGRILDPFSGDNEKAVMWVAESDWEYRRAIAVEPELLAEEVIHLVCDGLDTLADVTLNGQLLGQTDNMFRQYRWEVHEHLREGENELVIRFRSPVVYAREREEARQLQPYRRPFLLDGAAHVRKAPCHFGWDWGPKLPPIGIWKDIRLEAGTQGRILDVRLRQEHLDGRVRLAADIEIDRWAETWYTPILRITSPDGATQVVEGVIIGDSGSAEIWIDEPRLWQPNGMPSPWLGPDGRQPLYQVVVTLLAGGEPCDESALAIGLRTIELRQEPDPRGKSFTFLVNGLPVFCKGSNWIPADSFPTRLTDEHLEHLIRSAAVGNQNMLRVWGGGFYEEERFYDLCDRYGILVWQDAIFACQIYPLDQEAFHESVRHEVAENVRRLRNRASLALWCGNNEMEWGWESWGWAVPDWLEEARALAATSENLSFRLGLDEMPQPVPEWRALRDAYDRFFHGTLPAWLAELDPDTPYWPSSPSSDTPFVKVNDEEQGDAHYWGVWHRREPFTAYRKHFPRFMSEFGFQALPPLKTIAAYAQPEDWNLTSYIMEHHQRGNHGNGLIIGQMTESYRMPKDFPSLVYLSLLLQAEGIRYGVEHYRRQMHRISGTLYWQLNDCWPVASWSSIDYFGRWKALHYAAKRFYAPVLLSILDEPPRMGIHVSNDLPAAWKGEVRWSLETLAGRVLRAGRVDVRAAPLASSGICDLDFAAHVSDNNERDVVLACELWQGEEQVASRLGTFVPDKHLSLADPGLSAEVSLHGGQLAIGVTARSLARFVELELDGADVVFSDNYFDVPAGRTAVVTCPLPGEWTLERARDALRLRSLYDSFA